MTTMAFFEPRRAFACGHADAATRVTLAAAERRFTLQFLLALLAVSHKKCWKTRANTAPFLTAVSVATRLFSTGKRHGT